MASTYVNNLRLNEMATGDGSGTWGTTTNTNLELIGQALGWGTRAIANASTDNITIADGASDADRNMALKLTGGGQACTVTILPNTSSKVWVMENATAATLTFTAGSGANVAILAGETKMIATDGLGSGGVVYDVLTDLNLAGTTKAAALTVAGTVDAATVEFNNLSGTSSVNVTDIADEDNMSSNSATKLATQQSIKAYVDAQVDTVDTLAEVLAIGNTTATNQKIQFRDAAIHISSSADGQLDLVADTEIQIAATTVDINGVADISGNLVVGGNASLTGGSYFAAESYRYTDGTSSMTIGSGGLVTAVSGITSTAAANTFGATSFNDANITNVGDIQLDSITGDGDTDTAITFSGSNVITVKAGNANQVTFKDGAFSPVADSDVDLGTSSLYFKDAYIDTVTTTGAITAASLDISGSADIDGTLEADAITLNGTALGSLYSPIAGGSGIVTTGAINSGSITSGFGTINNGASAITTTGVGTFASLDISGSVDVDGTLEADAITLNGTALGSLYSPIAGGSGIVTTGAINSGSITSGFGTINNGASTITTTGAVATGAITAGGDITRGGSVYKDGSITDTGDFTLDIAGDIVLDADGQEIFLKNAGVHWGTFLTDGTPNSFYIDAKVSDGDMIFRGNDGGSVITALTLDMSAAGAATFNNDVTAFSDERLKSNITTIPDALSKVTEMRGVHYVRDATGKDSTGVIAQELQEIAPELVLTAEDEMGTLSVNYGNITGYLIEAIKELKAEIEELKAR